MQDYCIKTVVFKVRDYHHTIAVIYNLHFYFFVVVIVHFMNCKNPNSLALFHIFVKILMKTILLNTYNKEIKKKKRNQMKAQMDLKNFFVFCK